METKCKNTLNLPQQTSGPLIYDTAAVQVKVRRFLVGYDFQD
jgi:hypothetical protein